MADEPNIIRGFVITFKENGNKDSILIEAPSEKKAISEFRESYPKAEILKIGSLYTKIRIPGYLIPPKEGGLY